MAAKKSSLPPIEDIYLALNAALAAAPRPVTSQEIAKSGQLPFKITPAQLDTLLAQRPPSAEFHVFPPLKSGGKQRYWAFSPNELSRRLWNDLVSHLSNPTSAPDVLKKLGRTAGVSLQEVVAALELSVVEGRLFSIQPSGTGKKAVLRYTTQSPTDLTLAEVLQLLAKKGPLAEPKIKAGLAVGVPDLLPTILTSSLADGRLFRHPPKGKSKDALYHTQPVDPRGYLKNVQKELAKAVSILKQVDVSDQSLRHSLCEIMLGLGIPFETSNTRSCVSPIGPVSESTATPPSPAENRTSDALLSLMRQIEPRAFAGALVSLADLRAKAGLTKQAFDNAILGLARAGILALHRHDFVARLTEQEREALVFDGVSDYFNGAAIRQNHD